MGDPPGWVRSLQGCHEGKPFRRFHGEFTGLPRAGARATRDFSSNKDTKLLVPTEGRQDVSGAALSPACERKAGAVQSTHEMLAWMLGNKDEQATG